MMPISNDITEVRPILKLLEQRAVLALGSLSFVEKQLQSIVLDLDNLIENVYDEPLEGDKQNADSAFFLTPPLEVYER